MYIGFLAYLYIPCTTSFFGGSIGAGVPFPKDAKLQAHRIYMKTPKSIGIKPMLRMRLISTANLSPNEDNRKHGTRTKKTQGKRRVKIIVLTAIIPCQSKFTKPKESFQEK